MLRRGSKSAKAPKPAKAPKAPKAAKAAKSKAPGVFVQKSKSDIYTVMLGLSLAAILIAILFMFLEMKRYNMDFKAQNVQNVGPASVQRFV